jgi:serine/threonine protein kinase
MLLTNAVRNANKDTSSSSQQQPHLQQPSTSLSSTSLSMETTMSHSNANHSRSASSYLNTIQNTNNNNNNTNNNNYNNNPSLSTASKEAAGPFMLSKSISSFTSHLVSTTSSIQSLGHLIPLSVRLKMIRDCAAGLAYLHSKGFMHCDIKSLNFLVTSSLTVKLADLGEARRIVDVNVTQRSLPT